MKRMQAYKFQLRPNGQQERDMRRFAGACRFVFNKALSIQKTNHMDGGKFISYNKLAGLITEWKSLPELCWLKDSPSQPLQQSLRDLDRSFQNFFKKKSAFPNFKRKGNGDSFRYPQGVKMDSKNDRLFLPKLGWVKFRNSIEAVGEIKNVTISNSFGKWYASVQVEFECEDSLHQSTSIVGIDVGIIKLATLSDGTIFHPVNSFKSNQKKLATMQRMLWKKVKFSSNWKKHQNKIQKIHSKIANVRKDYLHKVTTIISKNHAVIIVEDLKIENMTKSSSGSIKSPGKNVFSKKGLNRSILDQGWGEMRRQLEYKQAWRGGQVIPVSAAYTSQKCACCGSINKLNRTSQSTFLCIECGYSANADVNGARNILAAGHAVLACGGKALSGLPVKQEPSEASQIII